MRSSRFGFNCRCRRSKNPKTAPTPSDVEHTSPDRRLFQIISAAALNRHCTTVSNVRAAFAIRLRDFWATHRALSDIAYFSTKLLFLFSAQCQWRVVARRSARQPHAVSWSRLCFLVGRLRTAAWFVELFCLVSKNRCHICLFSLLSIHNLLIRR